MGTPAYAPRTPATCSGRLPGLDPVLQHERTCRLQEELWHNRISAGAEPLETTEEYATRLEGYIGSDGPLAIQAQTPAIVGALVTGRTGVEVARQPEPGKWCVRAIVAHLADDELATAWRYRQMLEHCGVELMSFDQNLWARLGEYHLRPTCETLKTFELLRVANLGLLYRLSSEQWQRYGVHSERGRISVGDLARHMAGHDRNHILQLRLALDANGG